MRQETSSGEKRTSALWGRGGRGVRLLVVCAAILCLPMAAFGGGAKGALVPASLRADALAGPEQTFKVVVQAADGRTSDNVADDVRREQGDVRRSFSSLPAVAATLTGRELIELSSSGDVQAITPDLPTLSAGYENAEMWRQSANVVPLWANPGAPAPAAPAIAVVDSGIDATKTADFGARVVARVDLSSVSEGESGDPQGHGSMVAGIAAGAAATHEGVARSAPLIDVRTADAAGSSLTSDVIAACDWILAHKQQYGIRVANFSLAAAATSSFRFDPLDRAVERLWLSGVVVVAAAGNYGSAAGPVDMSHAPGNDPFVITVGALDQHQTPSPLDDTVPGWSAHGYTADGFAKPELSAPGRYLIMPVPMGSTISRTVPERVVAPGYMWMSGTSFAAPVVSGSAAQILARHPGWSPDQVKGALMLAARGLPLAAGAAGGVGEVDAGAAAALLAPPNPNAGLNAFVEIDPATGAPLFDQASWAAAAGASASWNAASWNAASWSEASWAAASWSEASWAAASWSEASWAAASWSEASWAE